MTAVPSAFVIDNVTPAMPRSPSSCTPSRSRSNHTKSPTETIGEKKPKSSVMSDAPGVSNSVDVAEPVDESVDDVPEPETVGIIPTGGVTLTVYWPTGRFSNRYFPFASVVVVVTGFPNTSVTAVPSAFVIDNVTPPMPFSPSSWTPSRSKSNHTKSPTETIGATKPKSSVASDAPAVSN